MRQRRDDEGFTMVELLFVMLLMGILTALVVGPYKGWRETREHKDTAREAVSAMRNAQVRSVAETTRYRVAFEDAGAALVVYRSPVAGTERRVDRVEVPNAKLTFATPSFVTSTGRSTSAYFYPRGSASAGSVVVARDGRDPVRIDVEGLTGRVTQDR